MAGAGDRESEGMSFVAIDIGKAFHAVLVELPDGAHQRFRMANSAEDYGRLVAFLHTLPGPVRVALEPTGNFHRTLAFRLLSEGISVVSVSSVAGARYREAMFNSRDKNDPKDATVILQLLKQGLVQHYHEPLLAGHHDLQELAKTYRQVTLARKRLATEARLDDATSAFMSAVGSLRDPIGAREDPRTRARYPAPQSGSWARDRSRRLRVHERDDPQTDGRTVPRRVLHRAYWAAIVRAIFQAIADGRGVSGMAKDLNARH